MLSVCEHLRCEVIQTSLVMLSRRANETDDAKKEQKYFQSTKKCSVKKKQMYRSI